jgi:methionine synthase II (cobalamin-independent)
MYVQFSERFPGITLEDGRIFVDRSKDLDAELERLYLAYLEDDLEYGYTSATYAACLDVLRQGHVLFPQPPVALKGQVTGPVSWGLTIVDQNKRPILYDEVLADAVGKHLRLKAAWQERELGKLAPRTITFIDEPYLASFGSAFVSLGRDQVIGLLEEVFAGLHGIKGVHCCGNTDWGLLLNTSVDILSLDAYDYAETLALYPEDVSRFLKRGGVIAWGIVPADVAAKGETAESLVARLDEAIGRLAAKGVPRDTILQASMVTPSCGLGSLPPDLAERIFELTSGVSAAMRRRYTASAEPPAPNPSA